MSAVLKDKADAPLRGAPAGKVQSFETPLLRRMEIAEDTMAFYFARPPEFGFRAGQAVTLTLANPPETDAKGDRRTFSIASAPYESELMVASRMRDTAFKRTLRTVALGTTVRLRGPTGSFTLPAGERRPLVMLAGGIGITPFVSMLREDAVDGPGRPIYLFYSNRTPGSAAFLPELTWLASANSRFRLVATMTDPQTPGEPWPGTRGLISAEMLTATLGDLLEPAYYVAGPPPMVAAMLDLLARMRVPTERIRTDEFFGY
ncbi:MAG TPA: FAD-dependent oxidoreductase [Burkholderiales bacterium]|nr:FAD-dependent oxidoreductase [Burkholderiales bacterium]